MNNNFDELTKRLAQSTTRRQALKKFGVGLAGIVLACFGLTKRAEAAHRNPRGYCSVTLTPSGYVYDGNCFDVAADSLVSSCRSCPAAGTTVGQGASIQQRIACGGFCSLVVDLNEKCNC